MTLRSTQLKPRERRGAAAVMVAATMIVLLGFVALTVDIGYFYNAHADMQDAVDASSLAGASALFDEPTACRKRAIEAANFNQAARQTVTLDESEIQLGTWSWMDKSFTVLVGSDEEDANAVRVVGTKKALPYFFARVFGINYFDVQRGATAHRVPTCGGIWGLDSVVVSGNAQTDSYRSEEESYSPGYSREHGDVCSNGPIDVIGSAAIRGDASAGPGYEVDMIGAGSVTGATSSSAELLVAPPVELNDVVTVNDNAAIPLTDQGDVPFKPGAYDLFVSGGADNLTLQAGTYYFTSMNLRSQATLTIAGKVIIYVSGDVDMTGGAVINASKDPHNLTIYSTGSILELYGGTGFFGAVYAPGTDVKLIGTSDYYGTIVGKTLDIGGTAGIHVDETLDLLERLPGPPFLVQ